MNDIFNISQDIKDELITFGYNYESFSMSNILYWLRTEQDIYVYPINEFHNREGEVVWSCGVYVPYSYVKVVGKKLDFEKTIIEGIKESLRIIKKTI